MWTIRGTSRRRLSKRRLRREAESMFEGGLFHVEQSPFSVEQNATHVEARLSGMGVARFVGSFVFSGPYICRYL